ncbi:MAG: polysaccharide pyruvyl transferase family protein [Anaerolineaceae bacterium]|nr:polysaccharide pyruvyl transferase family protein [Anaerolineaceae bacterium]
MRASEPSSKILLVNFHSTMNAGDLGLLISAREFLRRAFPSCEIKVSANWPDEPAYQEYGFEVLPSPWSFSGLNSNTSVFQQIRQFLLTILQLRNINPERTFSLETNRLRAAYRDADLIVSVPGNQFYSSGRYGWPFPVSISGTLLAHRYKKPLVVLPQSIGPLKRWWERTLIRKAYGRARRVFLRDKNSMELAKEIGLPMENVTYSPDLALGLKAGDSVQAEQILRDAGVNLEQPKLGITLISKMNRSFDSQAMLNYYSSIEVALSSFARENAIQIVFFNQVVGPTPVENDGIPTSKMVNDLRAVGVKAFHVDERLTPALLKACYGQMDAFVATRLHSGIYAIGMTVPTLFIGYLTKTQGIVKSLQIESDFIDIPALSEEKVRAKLDTLWANRIEKNQYLANVIAQSQQENTRSVELLKKDFADG